MTPDWKAIAKEYRETDTSLNALAARRAVPRSTLCDRARREGWADQRALLRSAGQESSAERILRVADKLVRRAEEILDGSDDMGARELGELMRAIKSAKEIGTLAPAAESGGGTLRIEFADEAEEAAR